MSADATFPAEQPLQGVLMRLSAHLDHLAEMAHEVEHAVADEMSSAETAKTIARVERLQNLDFLRQYTEDLALLTHYLSKIEQLGVVPGHQVTKLSKRVRLERTRALLFPDAQPIQGKDVSTDTGDVDLF